MPDSTDPTTQQQSQPTADTPKSPEETRQELEEAIEGSNDVLACATTTFTFFPDTLTIDRAKLTVFRRTFMRSAQIMSIRMEDILNVTSSVGPLMGSILVFNRVNNSEKPYYIGKFWRKDAMRMKRIAQGYVIALQRKIDCSSLQTEELVHMLERLGEDDHPSIPS